MKSLKILAALTITSTALPPTAIARDLIRIDRLNAQEQVVELDVTPLGLVIDFGSQISSVKLTHKTNIFYQGMDGALCQGSSNCSGSVPTILFVQKIPEIEFKDEEPVSGGYSLLYVDTASGLYRFKFKPVNKNPEYTKVEIQEAISPLFTAPDGLSNE